MKGTTPYANPRLTRPLPFPSRTSMADPTTTLVSPLTRVRGLAVQSANVVTRALLASAPGTSAPVATASKTAVYQFGRLGIAVSPRRTRRPRHRAGGLGVPTADRTTRRFGTAAKGVKYRLAGAYAATFHAQFLPDGVIVPSKPADLKTGVKNAHCVWKLALFVRVCSSLHRCAQRPGQS